MVTSRDWKFSAYAKESKGKKFVEDVMDSHFWKECLNVVKLTEPLVRVLRIVNSDERPAMGYLFDAIHVAKEEILVRFQRRKMMADRYMNIITTRWDTQLKKNIHAAGFWLNPSKQYDALVMNQHLGTISGVLDVIEKFARGDRQLRNVLTSQLQMFKNCEGDFGRPTARSDRHVMPADIWWSTSGS